MTDVDLRHLATMAAIVEEGSFGRAAARLGYTQSTVSQQVAGLERAVGGAVFDRPGGPRPVTITPLGRVVLAHGRELLSRARAMADAVDRFRAGEGRVDIGTFQSLSTVILPRLVRRLRAEYPDCDIRLFEEETDPPRVDDLDLVFFDGRAAGNVEHRKLLDDPYALVARRGAFPDGPVPLRALHDAPMVAWPAVCDQPRVEEAFARAGVRPRNVFRTTSNEAVLSMVRAGIGSAVLPRLVLEGVHETLGGVHETLGGVHETLGGVHETLGGVHETLEGRSRNARGLHETLEGVHETLEGVHETLEGVHETLGGAGETLAVHELRPAFPPREIYLLWPAGRTQSPLAARAIELATEVTARYRRE